MSRIDYSKWDHIDVSDSDSEEDKEERESLSFSNKPRVTKLEQPSRITTQADGSLLIQQQQETKATTDTTVKKGTKTLASTSETTKSSQKGSSSDDDVKIPASWTEKGGSTTISSTSNNNTILPLHWTQDRYSVTLRIQLPPSSSRDQKWNVKATGVLLYQDRNCAVAANSEPCRLQILLLTNSSKAKTKNKDSVVWWQDDLPHPVHYAQDDDDDDDETNVDWSIETLDCPTKQEQQRYMTITLYKAVPMEGLTLWWKRPVVSCAAVELTWRQADSNSSSAASAASFQQAWNDAHEQFRERMQNNKTAPSDIAL